MFCSLLKLSHRQTLKASGLFPVVTGFQLKPAAGTEPTSKIYFQSIQLSPNQTQCYLEHEKFGVFEAGHQNSTNFRVKVSERSMSRGSCFISAVKRTSSRQSLVRLHALQLPPNKNLHSSGMTKVLVMMPEGRHFVKTLSVVVH